jgi:hypothetical protein
MAIENGVIDLSGDTDDDEPGWICFCYFLNSAIIDVCEVIVHLQFVLAYYAESCSTDTQR